MTQAVLVRSSKKQSGSLYIDRAIDRVANFMIYVKFRDGWKQVTARRVRVKIGAL